MQKTKVFILCCLLTASLSLPMSACSPSPSPDAPPPEISENDPFIPDMPPSSDISAPENEPPMPEDTTSDEEEKEDDLPEEVLPMPEAKYIKVLCNGLNVRQKASTNSAVKGQVDRGERLILLGKEGNFYRTLYRGKTAYLSASEKYTAVEIKTAAEERIEKVIEEGGRLLGTPYVYGAVRYHNGNGKKLSGFSTDRFDCSSLMQYIFYVGAGELLQVNTRTQVVQGTAVARKDLRRGDLLFFTNATRKNNKGIERIGHVGLYLGDNLMLHTASDYAKIEEISPLRWSYYEQARRILP